MTKLGLVWRVACLFVLRIFATTGGFIVALLVDPWNHITAQVIANAWLILILVACTMRRPPALYAGYSEWWADRHNWWEKQPPC